MKCDKHRVRLGELTSYCQRQIGFVKKPIPIPQRIKHCLSEEVLSSMLSHLFQHKVRSIGCPGRCYQVPMRRTAEVAIRRPFWGRVVPTSDIQLWVYSTSRMRHAKGRVTTKSTPPPAAILGPLLEISTDQSLRFG